MLALSFDVYGRAVLLKYTEYIIVLFRFSCTTRMCVRQQPLVHPRGEGDCCIAVPPQSKIKKKSFVDTIWKVLHDLHFNLNWPQKWADY
jgi:hypothetical protein